MGVLGRAWAGALTALMTGHAYATSARTAARMGPFAGYADNAGPMQTVLNMHREEAAKIDEGLAPAELLAINPALVIVRISGWGQDGPFNHKPGFGTLVEGMSGFAAKTGFADREPVLPPTALADMIAGQTGAFAVMTALREVEVKGGDGQVIDLSLFEPIFSAVASEAGVASIEGKGAMRAGNTASHTAPRNLYICSDGKYVALSGSMQSSAASSARAPRTRIWRCSRRQA